MIPSSRVGVFLAVVTAGVVIAASQSRAVLWMNDSDLKTTFEGKTIAGLYPGGHGFIETFHRGGRVAYQDQVRQVGGRWSVSAGTFCTIYDGDAAGGCYSVRRMGKNCFEFYFMSRTPKEKNRPEEPTWTAQAWISDFPSTCVAGAEV